MQNAFQLLAALGVLAALASCSPGFRQGAVTPGDAGAPSEMPQSPNSLPPGSVTNAPSTGRTGNIGVTSP